jgi:hypothetical protein
MPRKSREQILQEKLTASMLPLCALPEFETFIEVVRLAKDEAVRLSIDFEGVKSERGSLVLKGEVRTYLNLLDIYEAQRELLGQHAKQAMAEAQNQQ